MLVIPISQLYTFTIIVIFRCQVIKLYMREKVLCIITLKYSVYNSDFLLITIY